MPRVNPVDSVGSTPGFDTGQGGQTGYASFANLFKDRRKNKDKKDEKDEKFRGIFDGAQKKYFKNAQKLERQKSELRDWEHNNRTQREWQGMAEKANIGDQEMSRFTGAHVPNLMQAMGADKLQNVNMSTTSGNKLSVAAAQAAKEEQSKAETPAPSTTEASSAPESRVAAMDVGKNEPKERTPSYKEVRAGVALWKKTKGETGVSPEEGVGLGNETYNRKVAAKAAFAAEKKSGIGSSRQFGNDSGGSADAQEEA
jgi:hypothetical protein